MKLRMGIKGIMNYEVLSIDEDEETISAVVQFKSLEKEFLDEVIELAHVMEAWHKVYAYSPEGAHVVEYDKQSHKYEMWESERK